MRMGSFERPGMLPAEAGERWRVTPRGAESLRRNLRLVHALELLQIALHLRVDGGSLRDLVGRHDLRGEQRELEVALGRLARRHGRPGERHPHVDGSGSALGRCVGEDRAAAVS